MKAENTSPQAKPVERRGAPRPRPVVFPRPRVAWNKRLFLQKSGVVHRVNDLTSTHHLQRARSKPSLARATSTVCSGIGATLLAATVLVCWLSPESAPTSAAFYLVAATLILVASCTSPANGALYLIISFYFAIFVALPGMVQVEAQVFPFASSYTAVEISGGYLVVALGHLALLAGVSLSRMLPRARHFGHENRDDRRLTHRSSNINVRFAVTMSIAALTLGTIAGPDELFSARFDDAANAAVSDGLGTQLALISRSLGLVALLLILISVKRKANTRPIWAACIFVSIVAFIVNYPPALPRFQLLGILLAIVVLLVNFSRPVGKIAFVAIGAIFVFFGFAFIKDARNWTRFEIPGLGSLDSYLVTADFDSLKQVIDTTIYFDTAALRWGENFLGVLFFWVPRSVWAEKPMHTGAVVSGGLGYPFTNVSSPLPAEAFASWGIPGVIMVMLLVGVAVAALERAAGPAAFPDASVPATITYALAAGYATIVLRGALNAVAPMFLTAFVLAGLVFLAYRRRSHNLLRRQLGPQASLPPEARS